MKILAVGGGSGGHVTPAVAVLDELKRRDASIEARFWCDKGFARQAEQIIASHDDTLRLEWVIAGKFRRYHHLTFLQHLLIPSVVLLNIRDIFLVLIGFLQSIVRLVIWRPDVVFTKGGFVCLPVGWAAWLLRIPLVIHDSDVVPGLTNRLLAKMATLIATGAPLKNYPYPLAKSHYVGIPIDATFKPYDSDLQRRAKQKLGFAPDKPLVVVIGGGLGSKPLNDATVTHSSQLLDHTNILLLSGKQQYEELRSRAPAHDDRFQLHAFISNGIVDVLGAADVVVSRAGATALLELAALQKPTILVPSSRLVWQVKHAKLFEQTGAVICLDETKFEQQDDRSYVNAIISLVESPERREALSRAIGVMAMPGATVEMADMIEQVTSR